MAKEFEVKRGQVFYIQVSGQTQPYIVLSNNKCNKNSSMIHAAPIRQGQPDPEKYYHVPYIATCHRCKYVDVGMIQLMSKELFSDTQYSSAESYYTVNNKDLMEGIADAICVHLGIHRNYVVYDEDPVKEEKKEPINITINLAGLPGVTAQVTETKEVQISPETVSTSIETVTEMEKEPVKFESNAGSSEWTVTNTRTGSETIVSIPKTSKKVKAAKSTNSRRTRFTESEKAKIMEFTKNNLSLFGGTMTQNEIAECLGVCESTIVRVTNKLKGNNEKRNSPYYNYKYHGGKSNPKFKERVYTITGNPNQIKGMTEEEVNKLISDYTNYGATYIVDNYPQFNSKHSVYNFFYRYCPKIEKVK